MSATERKRPEDFLELVERAKRGRLKVYLGFAAGVGKTYRMLEEAHALVKRGVDVVVGLVETHGRAETAALIGSLECVPRRRIEYRGVVIEEMDLEAILARQPQVAIVDEVAHTNVPGSTHLRRHQDIEALLEAGINVICAFNVQHLESLNDLVERATGVTIHETVPDTFLKLADQVVTVDLAVEDLLERLRAGKIYAGEKIDWALSHFFKDSNLATLRELVLREVAESVERAAQPASPNGGRGGPRPGAARVMVCIASASPRARELLRRGSRMAGRLNSDWYMVYVQTPGEDPLHIDATAQRQLHDAIALARELGAEVVKLKAHDPAPAILDFARTHAVSDIVVGRPSSSWLSRMRRRDVVRRLVEESEGFDLHIVTSQEHRAER
ncbi:MAG: universal stress protein [bacterium]